MVGEVLFGMLVVASTMSQAVEPAKLVLACQGHTHYLEADSQSLPVSLEHHRQLSGPDSPGLPLS